MSSLIIISGYMAAIISNVSLYPQAWEVRRIIKTCEYEKLNSISLSTFSLNLAGCGLWLIYGIASELYPIIFGSILSIIPSTYICIILLYWHIMLQPHIENTESQLSITHDDTIVIASGSSIHETDIAA